MLVAHTQHGLDFLQRQSRGSSLVEYVLHGIDGFRRNLPARSGADLRGDRSITKGEEYRDYCTGCSRPPTQCLCEHLPSEKIELETEVLVLQHPVEFRRKTISTVPLLKLVLEQCRVLVGRSFDSNLESIINEACAEGRIPLLLFPGPNASVLEDCGSMDRLHQMLLHF